MSAFACGCCHNDVDVRVCVEALPVGFVFFVLCGPCRGEGAGRLQAQIEEESRRLGETYGRAWLAIPEHEWGHA